MPNAEEIVRTASERTFNSPLVTNVFRSVLVEAMVSAALPDWRWCSADYAAYDFEHPSKARLEVKQTALRQTWTAKRPSTPSWDIRPRTGMWIDGTEWVEHQGRNADIYVFGLHPIVDDSADHRDPEQWVFYVVPEAALPNTTRLSASKAAQLATPARIDDLRNQVQQVLTDL